MEIYLFVTEHERKVENELWWHISAIILSDNYVDLSDLTFDLPHLFVRKMNNEKCSFPFHAIQVTTILQ